MENELFNTRLRSITEGALRIGKLKKFSLFIPEILTAKFEVPLGLASAHHIALELLFMELFTEKEALERTLLREPWNDLATHHLRRANRQMKTVRKLVIEMLSKRFPTFVFRKNNHWISPNLQVTYAFSRREMTSDLRCRLAA